MLQDFLAFFEPSNYIEVWLLFSFFLSFIVSFFVFPTIVHVALAKNLVDEPDTRSIHHQVIPTLGGIGIYLSMVTVMTVMGALLNTKLLLLVLGAMTFLFFLGLKDDLLILSPRKKFIGQLIAAFLLILFTDTRIISLSGLFGITVLPYWVSVLFTLFVYILIINAFNLVDGVDGLSGLLALVCSAFFVYIFTVSKDVSASTLAIGLLGALMPFLRLNFSKSKKIFMGDTGSLVIGFLIAFFVVRFISLTHIPEVPLFYKRAAIISLALVFYPLLDTFRIFCIRLFIHKTSPFRADRNHIHHRLLDMGLSHKVTTLLLVSVNIVLILFAFFTSHLDIHLHLLFVIFFGCGLYVFMFFVIFKRYKMLFKTVFHKKITCRQQEVTNN